MNNSLNIYKILTGFDFTIKEYIRKGQLELIKNAIQFIQKTSLNVKLSPKDINEIIRYIDSTITHKLLEIGNWEINRTETPKNYIFNFTCDNLKIKASADIYPKHIEIILAGTTEKHFCVTIKRNQPKIFTEYPFKGSEANEETIKLVKTKILRYVFCSNSSGNEK